MNLLPLAIVLLGLFHLPLEMLELFVVIFENLRVSSLVQILV